MLAISAMGLVKRYKNLIAVDKFNLKIHQGELFSLLGVNGAGKTTTIKMLTCLSKPTDGDAVVGGYSVIKDPGQVKQLIGVSPQETAVAPNLTVKENLELICGIHGFSKDKTHAKIRDLSQQLDLADILGRAVEVPAQPQNVGSVGAALTAAAGAGAIDSIEEASRLIMPAAVYYPGSCGAEGKAAYERNYQVFRKLHGSNKKLFAQING